MAVIYSYSSSYTGSSAYDAKNTAAKALIDSLASSPPTGFTAGTVISPDVGTSAQTFSVVLIASEGWRIRLSITTSTSASIVCVPALVNSSDSTIVTFTASANIGNFVSSTLTAYIMFVLNNYVSAGKYNFYTLTGYSDTELPFGVFYLTDTVEITPDFLIGVAVNVNYLYSVSGDLYDLTRPAQSMQDPATSRYVVSDAYAAIGGAYVGKLKDTIAVGTMLGQNYYATRYSVDGATYLAVCWRQLLIKL